MLLEEMTEEQKRKLLQTLKAISQYAELNSLGLVTVTGDCLAFFTDLGNEIADTFSAISASISTLGENVTRQLKQGTIQSVTIRGAKGFTLFYMYPPFILIGSSSSQSSIGLADRIFKRYIAEIPLIFDEEKDKDKNDDFEQLSGLSDLLKQ